jgi:hypothetical protein
MITDPKSKPQNRNLACEIAASLPALGIMVFGDESPLAGLLIGVGGAVVFLSVVGFIRLSWWAIKKLVLGG